MVAAAASVLALWWYCCPWIGYGRDGIIATITAYQSGLGMAAGIEQSTPAGAAFFRSIALGMCEWPGSRDLQLPASLVGLALIASCFLLIAGVLLRRRPVESAGLACGVVATGLFCWLIVILQGRFHQGWDPMVELVPFVAVTTIISALGIWRAASLIWRR
ncbi:MAG: hypothetical protein AB7K09_19805 [Planctomycetota bacterium]